MHLQLVADLSYTAYLSDLPDQDVNLVRQDLAGERNPAIECGDRNGAGVGNRSPYCRADAFVQHAVIDHFFVQP
jgi:hypothetical protein